MPSSIYVLGHKNPDSDSICSAIGYTALMHLQGTLNAVAARQGPLRRETAYILTRFGIDPPRLVTDVRPQVADRMTSPAICVHEDTSIFEVGQTIQLHGIRHVPVVDDEGCLQGMIGVEDLARFLISGLELEELNHVPLNLDNVVRALDGEVLVLAAERVLHDRIMVGAMEVDSMRRRLEPDILLVMGDRADAQRVAIECGVGTLVITGDNPVSPEIIELARRYRVTLITVHHHTYNTVRLIHMSTPVRHVMQHRAPTCGPDDLVESVQEEILRTEPARFLVVVNEDQQVQGIISPTDLLRPVHRKVVLVDHNERGQSVAGIEDAEVVGVIDHHRVADFQTHTPPFMRLEPVGSTSTIVAKLFAEADIPIPPPIAGVLLSGLLADTLLYRSPTTTPEDRRIGAELASCAGVDMEELGTRILELASDVSDRSAQQLLTADFKNFSVDGGLFGIGVIETTNGADVLAHRSELLAAMLRLRDQGYTIVLFAVIDILHERTTILAVGYPEAVAAAFGTPLLNNDSLELPGILSRKKQIVPLLGAISRQVKASSVSAGA